MLFYLFVLAVWWLQKCLYELLAEIPAFLWKPHVHVYVTDLALRSMKPLVTGALEFKTFSLSVLNILLPMT